MTLPAPTCWPTAGRSRSRRPATSDRLTGAGAIITPDGRTVVIVEELDTNGAPVMVSDRLLKVSAATGRVTVLNDRTCWPATSTSM